MDFFSPYSNSIRSGVFMTLKTLQEKEPIPTTDCPVNKIHEWRLLKEPQTFYCVWCLMRVEKE